MVADFVANETKYTPLQPGASSGVSVPLKLHDETLGVFSLESRREHTFSPQDVLTTRLWPINSPWRCARAAPTRQPSNKLSPTD